MPASRLTSLLVASLLLVNLPPLQAAPAGNDKDGDGIANNLDNCQNDANPDQLNTDGDNQGDVCDSDDDNDNLSDLDEARNGSDPLVKDTDGDGITDDVDPAPVDQLGLLRKIDGDGTAEKGGSAVATGDLNGDGVPEILFGTPYDKVYDDSSGKLIALSHAGTIKVFDGKTGSPLFTIPGTLKNQRLGSAIAVVPDQNSDGNPDIAVGEPLTNVSTMVGEKSVTLKAAGRVSLYSGTNGTFIRVLSEGKKAGDNFGASLAVGDVDNIGGVDLVVGEPLADIQVEINSKMVTLTNAGRVTVFQGISSGEHYSRPGTQKNARLGSAVAVDSDRHLLIGEPLYDVVTIINNKNVVLANAGRVQMFAGDEGSSAAINTLEGTTANDNLGAALATFSSDINSDGLADWMVGVPRANVTVFRSKPLVKNDAGKVMLFSGPNNAIRQTLSGTMAADRMGSAIATGDFNDDAIPEIVTGSPQFDVSNLVDTRLVKLPNAGRAMVYSGSVWLP